MSVQAPPPRPPSSFEQIVSDRKASVIEMQKAETGIAHIMKHLPENPKAAHPDAPPTSKEEGEYATAASADTFDMRSTVGGWWTKELANNNELKQAYTELGRNYASSAHLGRNGQHPRPRLWRRCALRRRP